MNRARVRKTMFYLSMLGVVLSVFGSLGCRAHQLRHDQDHMRQAVLDLYSNQLMDNLVRAHNGLPIVQLDYTNMTGTITQDTNATFGQQQTLETQRNSVGITTLRRFLNFTSFGIGGAERMQLTVTANPVTNSHEVYDAYLEFLSRPGQFIVTQTPPPPGAAHVVCCSCLGCCPGQERYYWVPCEYKYEFLELALATTVQRGRPLSLPEFFEVPVVHVDDDPDAPGYIVLYLATKIPNDDGRFTVTLGGKLFELSFQRYPATRRIDGELVKRGQKIDRVLLKLPVDKDSGKVLRIQGEKDVVGDLTPAEFRLAIAGQSLKIELTYYRPTPETTQNLLEAIRHETGLIRLQEAGR